jgi:hypothetical protein
MAAIRTKREPVANVRQGNMNFTEVIGAHPIAPNPFGVHFVAADEQTAHGVPHRILTRGATQPEEFVTVMRQWLIILSALP